ncbi:conserved hypothetical protein [Vibrio chagasii]|nr:conserved hypothetical protein [Vibrio chagasii]CAH6964616.1 conserved hypothetical protein [Vibrio chagasii]
MATFDFYNIDELIKDGVSTEKLCEIVAEANRFKVVQNSQLDKALFGEGTVNLSAVPSTRWSDELDAFVKDNLEYSGRFQIGEQVLTHNAGKLASDWYKSVIGLEATVTNSWVTANEQRKYEIKIYWNKHINVVSEDQLILPLEYNKPWWCKELTKRSFNKLYIELGYFESASKLLNELTDFVKNMHECLSATLVIEVPIRDLVFAIAYENKVSFVLQGQRSNRRSVLNALSENEQ